MRIELQAREQLPLLTTKEIIQINGGWHEGHYIFRTGEHGNGYIEKMSFLRYPDVVSEIGRRLAVQIKDLGVEVDVVVGPAIIGTVIASYTAGILEVPFTTTYRGESRSIKFHRGFIPEKGSKCLFVDDFVFSGTDLRDNLRMLEENDMEVVGASVIGIRSRQLQEAFPSLHSLMYVDFLKQSSEDCFLCKSNIPITASNVRE